MIKKWYKQIPNAITCLNLFSGILGVMAAYEGNYGTALLFVLLSATFDFFDGFAARLLHATSPIGKQLDSLSDLVSFGLVPGMIAFSMLQTSFTNAGLLPYLGFLITITAALRLAKFNIDERQATSFRGLATPANALFWTGLAYTYFDGFLFHLPMIILILVVIFSILQVADLPMFSLKIHSLKWSDNFRQYIFLIGVIVLLLLFTKNAVSLIIMWYICLAMLFYILEKRK